MEDVLAVMRSAGVGRAVLCQHLGEYDNEYLAQVVATYPATFAAVCLVNPMSPSAAADLDAQPEAATAGPTWAACATDASGAARPATGAAGAACTAVTSTGTTP